MVHRVDFIEVERDYRRLQYQISNLRRKYGVTIEQLMDLSGLGKYAFTSVAYGKGGTSIFNVLSVVKALGCNLVLVKEDAE